jgi:hypothetical protein
MTAHEDPQDQKDGSVEPVIMEHFKTLYYYTTNYIQYHYDSILQVYRIIHALLCFSLLCFPLSFNPTE